MKAMKLCFKKKYTRALPLFLKAIEDKDNAEYIKYALYNGAICLMNLENYINAISLLKMFLEIEIGESILYFNLAYCYFCIGNNKKALVNFNTAWALSNEDVKCEEAVNSLLNKLNT